MVAEKSDEYDGPAAATRHWDGWDRGGTWDKPLGLLSRLSLSPLDKVGQMSRLSRLSDRPRVEQMICVVAWPRSRPMAIVAADGW
jgi:hypothetical protein